MILELKLRKVGNSIGLLLPRAALDHLGVATSGNLFVTPLPDGALRISALDPGFAQKVKAGETSMQESGLLIPPRRLHRPWKIPDTTTVISRSVLRAISAIS